MDFMETISGARDAITVKRVYSEPYERNGVAVIPAAAVQGGGGGGGGDEPDGRTGGGGGFATSRVVCSVNSRAAGLGVELPLRASRDSAGRSRS